MAHGVGHSRFFFTRKQLTLVMLSLGLPTDLPARDSYLSYRIPLLEVDRVSVRRHVVRSNRGERLYRVDMWNSELLKALKNKGMEGRTPLPC